MDKNTEISILLCEYNTLRSELESTRSNLYTLLGIYAASFSIVISTLINYQGKPSCLLVFILLCSFFASFFFMFYIFKSAQDGSIPLIKRIRDIENEVNKISGKKLLIWENEHGWGSLFRNIRKL